MNVQKAAKGTLTLIKDHPWKVFSGQTGHETFTYRHIVYMLEEIVSNGEMKNDQANRWLGWAQAIICIHTEFSVKVMKMINKST